MIGQTFGRYTILQEIGAGGMGVVYKALDPKLNRHVALKILQPQLASDPQRRQRFEREARAAAALNHPNICTIHEVGEDHGTSFLVLELLEGESLRKRIGHRPLPLKQVLPLAIQIGEALVAAHGRTILHRDLKPENIFVTPQGAAKVLDFGLAKVLDPDREAVAPPGVALSALETRTETISSELTREGKLFGTPAYMSPEQARGERVTHQSDLFSFGVVLYEMASGKGPFKGRSNAETLASIMKESPPPLRALVPDVNPDFERIVAKALEKELADRYHHADEMVADLIRLRRVTESGVQALPTPTATTVPRLAGVWQRLSGTRARRLALASSLAAVLAAGGIATWRSLRIPARFHSGETVLVTDFENRTNRPEFEIPIRDAFEHMFADSRYLKILGGNRLRELANVQGGGRSTKITAELADRICRKGDCAGFFAGTVHPEGSGYRFEIGLHRKGRMEPVVAKSALAPSEGEILMTLHGMSLDFRRAVGEAPQMISLTSPPTTRSLRAYQALASAYQADDDLERGALFRRALELDPEFVDAYSGLTDVSFNLGRRKDYKHFAEEAYRRSSNLPEYSRLWIETNRLDSLHDFDGVVELLKRAENLYPFDDSVSDALCAVYLTHFRDPFSAEPPCRQEARMEPEVGSPTKLALSLGLQGKVEVLYKLADDYQARGGEEAWALAVRMFGDVIRGDREEFEQNAGLLERQPGPLKDIGAGVRFGALLGAGRLAEARSAGGPAWRASRGRHSQNPVELRQAWLEMRLGGGKLTLSPGQIEPGNISLSYLPDVATFSVEAGASEPLAELIHSYEISEKDSKSSFVQEELEFSRGCLALIRGQSAEARRLLEPLARNSILVRRHRVLGRTYEALRLWREAASAYEEALRNPYLRWWEFDNPAVFVLDQYRLARVYERLGDAGRARQWYERFLADWKNADPDIPELSEARSRLGALAPH